MFVCVCVYMLITLNYNKVQRCCAFIIRREKHILRNVNNLRMILSISVVRIEKRRFFHLKVFFFKKETGHTVEGSLLCLANHICNAVNYLIKTKMCVRKNIVCVDTKNNIKYVRWQCFQCVQFVRLFFWYDMWKQKHVWMLSFSRSFFL